MKFARLAPWIVLGCQPQDKVSGLAGSLLDPDASYLEVPGRKIASGLHSKLQLDASASGGARLLALRHTDDSTELAIINFENGTECTVGPASSFLRIASAVDVNLPPLVAYLGELDEFSLGTLHFVDFNCEERLEPIENATLPQALYPRSDPRGFLLVTPAGDVHFIDPKRRTREVVQENLGAASVSGDFLWLLKEGQVIALDADLEEVARHGSAVSDYNFTGALDGGEVVFIDEGDAYIAALDEEPRLVAEDACWLAALDAPETLAFFAPCEERRLAVLMKDPKADTESDDYRLFTLGDRVVQHGRSVASFGSEPEGALYVVNDTPNAESGTLMWHPFDEDGLPLEAEAIAETVHFTHGGALLADWDGKKGTLIELTQDPDDGMSVTERVAGVTQLPGFTEDSPLGILANFDGSLGDLVRLGDDDVTVLASDVPRQNHARDYENDRSAFVADYDQETTLGSVYILDRRKATRVADGSLINTLRFAPDPPAVAYLAGENRSLTLYLENAEQTLEVAKNVGEYQVFFWPSAGLLYATTTPGKAGVWFARAR